MHGTGSVIDSPYPRAVQRHGVESLAVVELLVELVRDLAVLASYPGPRSTTVLLLCAR